MPHCKEMCFFWDTNNSLKSSTYFENEIQSLYIGVFVTQLYWPTSFTPLKNRHAWWWWIIECYWVDCSPKCNFCHLKSMWEIHLSLHTLFAWHGRTRAESGNNSQFLSIKDQSVKVKNKSAAACTPAETLSRCCKQNTTSLCCRKTVVVEHNMTIRNPPKR